MIPERSRKDVALGPPRDHTLCTMPTGCASSAQEAVPCADGEVNPWARRRDIQRALSYKLSYNESVADTITFRPDEDASKALAVLTKDGTPVSTAVRAALIDAARRKATAAIRAEAERLADDEDDRAEAMQVLRDMETLRAW